MSHPGQAVGLGYSIVPQPTITASQDFVFDRTQPQSASLSSSLSRGGYGSLGQPTAYHSSQLRYDRDTTPLGNALSQLDLAGVPPRVGYSGMPYSLMYDTSQQLSAGGLLHQLANERLGKSLGNLEQLPPLSSPPDVGDVRQLPLTPPSNEVNSNQISGTAAEKALELRQVEAAASAGASAPLQSVAAQKEDAGLDARDSSNNRDHKLPQPPPISGTGDAHLPALPAGYVLIPPNFLVTIESLRKAGFATMGDAIATLTNRIDRNSYAFPLAGTSGYNAGFTNTNQGTQVNLQPPTCNSQLAVVRSNADSWATDRFYQITWRSQTHSRSSESQISTFIQILWHTTQHPSLPAQVNSQTCAFFALPLSCLNMCAFIALIFRGGKQDIACSMKYPERQNGLQEVKWMAAVQCPGYKGPILSFR